MKGDYISCVTGDMIRERVRGLREQARMEEERMGVRGDIADAFEGIGCQVFQIDQSVILVVGGVFSAELAQHLGGSATEEELSLFMLNWLKSETDAPKGDEVVDLLFADEDYPFASRFMGLALYYEPALDIPSLVLSPLVQRKAEHPRVFKKGRDPHRFKGKK